MAIIPAMITGTTHFIIKSGRKTDIAEIPTPDLAVPYAAPMPIEDHDSDQPAHGSMVEVDRNLQVKTMAEVQPMAPKKGAYTGHSSEDIVGLGDEEVVDGYDVVDET